MSENDKRNESLISKAKDTAGALGAAGAAIAQAVVVQPNWSKSELIAAMVLAALFPPVLAALTEASARRLKARADNFVHSIVNSWSNDANITAEEVAAQLEARREEPSVNDAIWRAVRGLMDAPNESAAIPLGVLAAEYARKGRKADIFFRGTVRLLSELSEDEFAELRALLSWLLESTQSTKILVLAYNKDMIDGKVQEIPWKVLVRRKESKPEELIHRAHIEDAGRLLILLTANGLAADPRGSYFDFSPIEAELERQTVARLAHLLSVG